MMYCCFSLSFLFLIMQGYSMLNERMVLYLPSAMYALCAGCVPFTECFKEIALVYSSFDAESLDNFHKVQSITLP